MLQRLTLHLDRVPPDASIQTYSAITEPFWGRLRYFWSCAMSVWIAQQACQDCTHVGRVGQEFVVRRLWLLSVIVQYLVSSQVGRPL